MRARTFACLAPLAFAWGCSQGTLEPGDAAVDAHVPDTARPDVAFDAGPPPDAPSIGDASMPDASIDTAVPPVLTGRRSFVVTSTITAHADGGAQPANVPSSQTFTMVVDAEQGTAIVGTAAGATSLPADVSGSSLRLRGSFSIGFGGCFEGATYQDAAFAVGAGGQLTGNSNGRVSWLVSGDVGTSVAASMALTGVNDTQSPTFSVSSNAGDVTDPFTSFSLVASEPLPPDARPRLIGGAGGDIVYLPSSAGEFAISFWQPTLLRYDTQYRVALDGVVDFAGNAAAASTVQLTTRPAPPLVTEDGFESATGATLGGAQVLSGTDAPVITGARSLYVPVSQGTFTPVPPKTQLALRLLVSPGDTVVRFAYRTVNPISVNTPVFAVASQGGSIGTMRVTSTPSSTTSVTIPGAGQVSLGPLAMAEIPLPMDATSEIVVARITPGIACSGLPQRPSEGMIIDDLRVE